jgi:hypothetical protein
MRQCSSSFLSCSRLREILQCPDLAVGVADNRDTDRSSKVVPNVRARRQLIQRNAQYREMKGKAKLSTLERFLEKEYSHVKSLYSITLVVSYCKLTILNSSELGRLIMQEFPHHQLCHFNYCMWEKFRGSQSFQNIAATSIRSARRVKGSAFLTEDH